MKKIITNVSIRNAYKKYISEYLSTKSNAHKECFKWSFNHFCKFTSIDINVRDINKYIFIKYVKYLKKGRSIETVRTYVRYLKIFFNFLVDENLIEKSPIPKNLMPKPIKKPISTFDYKVLNKIYEIAKGRDYKYYLILKMLELTGQRPCDVLNLFWKDININNKYIKIKISKTSKIILFPVYQELDDFITEELIKHFEYKFINKKIFTGYSVEILGKRFRRIKKFLNINEKGVDLKTFRKTFGTKLASLGIECSKIADLLGHDSVNTTKKYYAKIENETLRNELNSVLNNVR